MFKFEKKKLGKLDSLNFNLVNSVTLINEFAVDKFICLKVFP